MACQIAKAPGFTAQAGELLNSILQELCQTYDFDVAQGTFTLNFLQNSVAWNNPNVQQGSAYDLPADFLRQDINDIQWFLQGVVYKMVAADLDEFDSLVQTAGLQSYPYIYTIDMGTTPPVLVVWPPPSGGYQLMGRYRRQMPDIATPASSSTVPWFPNSNYLYTRLAGELMKLTDDDRVTTYLGNGTEENVGLAGGILRSYLKLKDNQSDRAQTVKRDPRRFGSNFNALPVTKQVGW